MLLDLALYNPGLTCHFLATGPKNQCLAPQPCLHPVHSLLGPAPSATARLRVNAGLSTSVRPGSGHRGAAVQALGSGAAIARSGHRTHAGPRRGVRGTEGAREGGHRPREGIGRGQRGSIPTPATPLRERCSLRGSSAPNVGERRARPPRPARRQLVGGRQGRGEVGDAGSPRAAPAHPLRLQHVARRRARRRGPRAALGPPPPVRRHPGGAGPHPAARSLLQPGEAAGPAGAFSPGDGARVEGPGLSGPQFTRCPPAPPLTAPVAESGCDLGPSACAAC